MNKYGKGEYPIDTRSTKWKDLDLQLEKEYVYSHAGNCQHVFHLVEISQEREKNISNTIPTRIPGNNQLKKCTVCKTYTASFTCYLDEYAICNPIYYCKACMYIAHYHQTSGALQENSTFLSYPYIL